MAFSSEGKTRTCKSIMFQGTTVVGDDTHVSRRVCCCCSRNTCGVCVHCGFAVVVVCLDLERRSLMLLHSRVVEYQSETKLVFLGCLFHSLSTIRFIYFIMFFQVFLLRRIFPVCLWRVALVRTTDDRTPHNNGSIRSTLRPIDSRSPCYF